MLLLHGYYGNQRGSRHHVILKLNKNLTNCAISLPNMEQPTIRLDIVNLRRGLLTELVNKGRSSSSCFILHTDAMEAVNFIQSLELEEHPPLLLQQAANEVAARSLKGKEFVDCGSLVSFTSNLGDQQKEDVLNGTLLAQLAANKKHDRFSDVKNWYKFYVTVMQKIGWVLQGLKFDEYHSTQEDFTISEVVLQLLSDLLGGDEEMLKLVKDTLSNLQKSSHVSLFGSSSSSVTHGSFQIVPCRVDKSNQVNVAFIASHFQASQVSDNYLFFTWKKESIRLFKTANVLTLNEDLYAQVRQTIKDKLGDRAKKFIKDLDI